MYKNSNKMTYIGMLHWPAVIATMISSGSLSNLRKAVG